VSPDAAWVVAWPVPNIESAQHFRQEQPTSFVLWRCDSNGCSVGWSGLRQWQLTGTADLASALTRSRSSAAILNIMEPRMTCGDNVWRVVRSPLTGRTDRRIAKRREVRSVRHGLGSTARSETARRGMAEPLVDIGATHSDFLPAQPASSCQLISHRWRPVLCCGTPPKTQP
jgi:hypothetical protein